ncbi:hypothetical protein [Escherichia coli]|nr:hypothetical protein [Escherichia coli]
MTSSAHIRWILLFWKSHWYRWQQSQPVNCMNTNQWDISVWSMS